MPATDSPAKRRGGRPKKIEAERRCKQTNHRWTIAEDAFLREQAAAADLSVAEFIRRRALLIPVVPPRKKVDARLLMELNAIGNNVNQLARDRLQQRPPKCPQPGLAGGATQAQGGSRYGCRGLR